MSLSLITLELVLRNILQNGWPIHHIFCDPLLSSTHRFPYERTPIEARPLSATSAELGLGLELGLDWIHSHTPPRTRSPSSRHPHFTN